MKKNKKGKLETRGAFGEIRAIDGDQGIVEAYLTKWGTVDSYNTSFEKGSFANTFSKRGTKGTRLFWNHRELAGKILELREDDTGPYVKVQFNLETRAGSTAYSHVKAGDVDCFSFGFNTVADHWVSGVRSIKEVDMLECGPVIFQANDEATITDIRAEDFEQTFTDDELRNRGWKLLRALDSTIEDIYWMGEKTAEETITAVDTCISKFHTAYIGWLNEWYGMGEERSEKTPPREIRNKIQRAIEQMASNVDELAKETALTSEEARGLSKGDLLPMESRSKLDSLPEAIRVSHREIRNKKVESLCDELRTSGFSAAELDRFSALLELRKAKVVTNEPVDNVNETTTFFKELRETL